LISMMKLLRTCKLVMYNSITPDHQNASLIPDFIL